VTSTRAEPGEAHDPIATVLRHDGWRTAAFFPPAVFFVDAQDCPEPISRSPAHSRSLRQTRLPG